MDVVSFDEENDNTASWRHTDCSIMMDNKCFTNLRSFAIYIMLSQRQLIQVIAESFVIVLRATPTKSST